MKIARSVGFTLFEVLLAIALSAIVLFLVAMAVRLHLQATDTRRTNVEEAQLARAVLQRIASDLRGTVQYKPIDFSSVAALGNLEGLAEGDVPEDILDGLPGGEDGGDGTGLGGNNDGGDATGEQDDAEPDEEVADIAGQVAPRSVPGLYGNRDELQLDVSRLPRLDEYDAVIRGDSGFGATDLPSDIKTVAYYVAGAASNSTSASATAPSGFEAEASLDIPETTATSTGLVRRSLDRAVTQYAVEVGDLDELSAAGVLLAPEVVAIEFRYTDGVEWFEEWNTDEQGGLPVAVQVAVGIDMHASERSTLPSHTTSILTSDETDLPQAVVYRLTVHLLSAESPTEEEQLSDEELFP